MLFTRASIAAEWRTVAGIALREKLKGIRACKYNADNRSSAHHVREED